MSFDIQMENGLTTLNCQGDLTISQIADFKKTITDIMQASKEVFVDLSKITDMDIACLQLLCSANKTFEQNKTKLTRLGDQTEMIRQTLLDSGYNPDEGCPEAPCENCFWKGEVN